MDEAVVQRPSHLVGNALHGRVEFCLCKVKLSYVVRCRLIRFLEFQN